MDREELKVWSLSFSELDFVQGYRHAMRAGLAFQLVHFRSYGYFPKALEEIADDRIQYVEEQLGSNLINICQCLRSACPPRLRYLRSPP